MKTVKIWWPHPNYKDYADQYLQEQRDNLTDAEVEQEIKSAAYWYPNSVIEVIDTIIQQQEAS